jgi:frataxin-like iron-binding protein CyaY
VYITAQIVFKTIRPKIYKTACAIIVSIMAGLLEQPAPIGSHQFVDKLALFYHYEIAKRLRTDPEFVIEKARSNLERWLATHVAGSAEAYCLEEWKTLLDSKTVPELITLITEDSDEGQRLRSSTPFTGILSAKERKELFARCCEEGPVI